MRAFKHPKTGAVLMSHSNKPKLDQWRDAIRYQAQQLDQPCVDGPIQVNATFVFSRPKSLKKSVKRHTKRPDTDKLIRGVLDALTGVFFKDDSQVDYMVAEKRYADAGEPSGVRITVTQWGE